MITVGIEKSAKMLTPDKPAATPAESLPNAHLRHTSKAGFNLRDACRRLWRAERTRAELSALSDPELKDMGLFRCDIGRVAADNYR